MRICTKCGSTFEETEPGALRCLGCGEEWIIAASATFEAEPELLTGEDLEE